MPARLLAVLDRLGGTQGVDFGLRFVLLLFVLSPTVVSDEWFFRFPLRSLAILALVAPPLLRDPRLWSAIAALMLAKSVRNWWTQDNHLFLLTWFCCAVALSLRTREPDRDAAWNARMLLGIAFAFAALWKALVSGEFVDGTYFEYTFLTDARFAHVAAIAGVPADVTRADLRAVATLAEPGGPASVVLRSGGWLGTMARLSALWTCAVELAIAVTCLAPSASPLSRARHSVLWVFALTTYAAVPVEQFGWTLLCLGAVSASTERGAVRAAYLLVALAVLAWDHVPIAGAVSALL